MWKWKKSVRVFGIGARMMKLWVGSRLWVASGVGRNGWIIGDRMSVMFLCSFTLSLFFGRVSLFSIFV